MSGLVGPARAGTVAVTGATGVVGRRVLTELCALGVRPRALLRPGRALPVELSPSVRPVPTDLTDTGSVRTALAGVRTLFLLTPLHPEQDALQLGVLDAALAAGVEHVVKLSALGADPAASAMVLRQHGRVEAELVRRGIRHTVLRPNAFMQNATRWLEGAGRFGLLPMPVGAARVSMVDAADIAAVAARAIVTPAHRDVAHDLTGPAALSYAEVAGILAGVLGRPVRYADVSEEEAAAAMRVGGTPEWAVRARLELYRTYRAGEAAVVTTAVADVTGRPPRPFREVAAELVGGGPPRAW